MQAKVRGLAIICIVILLLIAYFPTKATTQGIDVSARSAILMDETSGRVIYEVNAHEKSRIASITKIMTAILAIESGELDEIVTVSGNAVGTEGSSLYLKEGEKIKLEDLVYGLMLRSGNDAAVAIAEKVGGSFDGFVWMMNQKAEEIGMKNTNFSNPHGLDTTENHYSTAYDMALLTRYAMQNETYAKIAGTKEHRAPNSTEDWDYVWKNKNRLLTQLYEYTTGGKTGYTKLAKRTLVTTATKKGHNLIAVTINAPDDWNDHIHMYESAFRAYKPTKVLEEGVLSDLNVKFYNKHVYIQNEFTYPLTKKEQEQVEVKIKLLKPKKEWDERERIPEIVGKAHIYLNGEKIGTRTIFYGQSQETFKQESFGSSWLNLFQAVLGMKRYG
ncbi:D-alanyl-D-alanine carboxypeptidase family protein [Peribacillus asahii]|uniref:D-alanyl-D-alanine carboxypeptidase family protein n=1 Tax=Peribacillus asahii TaxID=228899 RepID=UPI0020795FF4|nr:D-alanyl-D-alanine carboxypeptidase family protein [Peribacillus asahii]USK58668.1 D-alanyl-D-alanine carboxypeptidase [Peribacillus asahii]